MVVKVNDFDETDNLTPVRMEKTLLLWLVVDTKSEKLNP